jgi:hypothetical protein
MGYDIPIFYFPVDPSEIGSNEISIEYVQNLNAERYKNAIENDLYETNSHNWWHQNIILVYCTDMKIIGLEFLENEISYLDLYQLAEAKKALTLLLNNIRSGIFPANKPEEYSGFKILRKVDFKQAFAEASPSYNVDYQTKNDFEEAVSFYAFIKSLHKAIEEALAGKQYLIYYRPKP